MKIKQIIMVIDCKKNKYSLFLFIVSITFMQIHVYGQIFTKMNIPAITEKKANGYGCAFYDFNNDGKLDIIVNNYNSATTLFKNNGGDDFSEVFDYDMIPIYRQLFRYKYR